MRISYDPIKTAFLWRGNRYFRANALLFIAASGTGCQARAEADHLGYLVRCRAIDISIWKHRQISNGDKFELVPSNPTRYGPKDQIPKYRINVEIDHNVELRFCCHFFPQTKQPNRTLFTRYFIAYQAERS